MSFSDITRWLFSDWTHAVSGVVVALLAYSMIWAMVRASIERVTGRPLARTRLVLVLDVVADVANNLPGALNRVLRAWGHPLFLPAPSASQPPAAPSGRSGEAGRATVATLALLALVGALGLAACPRAREAVVDTQSPRVACAPTSQRCHDGAPEVCSRAGRWWPAMPPQDDGARRRCADVCEVSPAGIAHCASSQVVTP